MGLRPVEAGVISHLESDITHLSTRERIHRSISYVSSDRHRYGLVLPFTVAENIAIGYHDRSPNAYRGQLDYAGMNSQAAELIERFDIRTSGPEAPAMQLSGGNQQKVILAREFSRKPTFLLVNQPTRGLDVGAIEYIHSEILAMRDQDVGVLLISLELEEIFGLADRILVLFEGRIVRELVTDETDEREVGFHMTGGKEQSA